ncbi:MAG: VCBS repeat-containing protein, partial [Chloroflexi bacterium]|nr:VCBS repeat-containing protein [Chloroflexota bacterium]
MAGAAGQAGRLFLARGGGRFEAADGSRDALEADRASEDMAPLWLDADSDGDLDLIVTSGGVEHEVGDERLEDRLYLNDGRARLTRAPAGALPPARVSSGAAVAADIEGDGDLDLFIGGRVVPGRYPETPESRLLRNDGGRYTDITDAFALGLRKVGMVTGALWSDADADGRIDLLACLEWGPVKLFRNTGRALEDQTGAAGLDGRLGWWNSITGADIDRDGDTDYVVMNVGLNTKYGAPTAGKPALLYYGDMEGNGRKHLIEAKTDKDGPVPVRGRSCSSSAMPMVAE